MSRSTESLEIRTVLSPFYDLSIVASTSDGFVGFGDLASINNSGTVAFVGFRNDYDSEGNPFADESRESGLWIRNSTGGMTNVNPEFSNTNDRDFGRAVAINDNGILTARDRLGGHFFLREWDSTGSDDFTTIVSTAPGLVSFGKYSGFQTFTDINNRGDIAFVGQTPGGEFRTIELQPYNQPDGSTIKLDTFPSGHVGGPTPRVQLTEDGRVLARLSNGNIVLLSANGAVKNFVTAADGFIETGAAPGITSDGRVVVFTGNRGRGAGVFAAYYSDGVRQIVPIAGEGLDGWTGFELNSAVRVSGTIANDSDRGVTVAFEGTNSTVGHGLYTARVSFFGRSGSDYYSESIESVRVSGAAPVVLLGDTIPQWGGAITEVEPYGINDQGRGELAFWVKAGSQEAIVRALPQQLVYVDMNPGLYPLPGYTPANLSLLAEVGLQNGWEGTFSDAMQSVGYGGSTSALSVSIREKVQEIFGKTGARIRVVSSPPDSVPRTATDNAGNILRVNGFPIRNGTFQTVQVGMNSSAVGLLGLAAPVYSRAGEIDFFNQVVDDLSVVFVDQIFKSSNFSKPLNQLTDAERAQAVAYVIAHEAAHNFGLVHTRSDFDDDVMNATTQQGELEEQQDFSDEPTELTGSLGLPGAQENPTARLLYATGGTYARPGDAPLPALLGRYAQFSVYERYKLSAALSSNSQTTARIVIGTVNPLGEDYLPEFQDLGSGTLGNLFSGAAFLMPKGGEIIVIGSTDGVRADIIGIPTSAAGIQDSLSLSALGVAADSRLRGQAGDSFNLYHLPASGPAVLIGTFSAEGEPAASILVGSEELVAGSALGLGETIPAGGALTKTLTIVNSGAAPLVLGTVAVTGPGYSVTQPSQTTLAPGEQTTVVVTLSDATAGIGITGTLTIPSNVSGAPFQLTLRGTVDSRPRVTGVTRIDNGAGPVRVAIDFSGQLSAGPAGNALNFSVSDIAGQGLPVESAEYSQTGATSRVVLTLGVTAADLPTGDYQVRFDGTQVVSSTGAPLATTRENLLVNQVWESYNIALVGANGVDGAGVLSGPESSGLSAPEFIVNGDFNGDGIQDIVATGRLAGNLVFHWGLADGGYETEIYELPTSTPTLKASPQSMIAADWNDDGVLDLIVYDAASDYYQGSFYRLHVLLNDGSGGFTAAMDTPIPVSSDVRGPLLGVGDFTGDGEMDIAIGGPPVDGNPINYSAKGSIAIYGRDPFLGYSQVDLISTEHAEWYPYAGVATDLNGDGRLDLVVSTTGYYLLGPSPVVFLNGPNGLVLQEDLEYGGEGGDVAVADFTGDGILDIAVINDNYSNNAGIREGNVISLLIGNGSGQFTAQPNILMNRRGISFLATGDLNQDGKPDLVLRASPFEQEGFIPTLEDSIWTVYGTGFGEFDFSSPMIPFSTTGNTTPGNFVLKDLTGDGALDLTFGNLANGRVGLLVNDGNGTLAPSLEGPLTATETAYQSSQQSESGFIIADLNRDGFPDQLRVVQGINYFIQASIDVYWGTASGEFEIVNSFAVEPTRASVNGLSINTIGDIDVSDLNNDGWLDIIVIGSGNAPIDVYFGVDGRNFHATNDSPFDAGPGTSVLSAQVVDVNRDGNRDVLATIDTAGNIGFGVFFGNGTGKLTYNANSFQTTSGMSNVAPVVADVNGDQIVDVMVARYDYNNAENPSQIQVFLGLGNGRFNAGQTIYLGISGTEDSFFLADVNGDSKLDLLAQSSYTLVIHLGTSGGQFAAAPDWSISIPYRIAQLAIGDFTGDGFDDIALTQDSNQINSFTTTLPIFAGDGTGYFAEPEYVELNGYLPYNLAIVPIAGAVEAGAFSISRPTFSPPTGSLNLSLSTPFERAVKVDPRTVINQYSLDPITVAATVQPQHGTVVVQNQGTPGNLADDTFLYTPAAGFSGIDTFTYLASDGRGGTATGVVTITVGAQNQNPVITLSPGAALISSEYSYQAFDPNATVVDGDSADFNGGRLTVQITSGLGEDDQLGLADLSPGPGEITVGFDDNVSYNGTVVGQVGGGAEGTPLVIRLTTNAASQDAVNAILSRVAYLHYGEVLVAQQRTLSITLTDGDGGSTTVTKVLNIPVTGNNSAPTLNLSQSPTQYSPGGTAVVVDSTATVTDSDSSHFANGFLVVQFQYGMLDGDQLAIRSAGTGAGQINLQGNKVRSGLQIFGVIEVEFPDQMIMHFNSNATPAIIQALTRQFTFSSSKPNPGLSDRIVRFTLTDGDGIEETTAEKTIRIAVDNHNQSPEINLSGGSAAYSAGHAAVVLDPGATVSDSDSSDFDEGVLIVSVHSGGSVDDRLGIKSQGTGTGQINLAGDVIRFGSNAIGTYTGGFNDASDLVITLYSNATPTSVTALLRSITFSIDDASPSTTARAIRFVLEDGDGGTSEPVDKNVTVSVPTGNPGPTLQLPSANPTYSKAAQPVAVDGGAIVLNPTLGSGTLGGGVLTVSINDVNTGRKKLDIFSLSSLNGIGVSRGTQLVGGRLVTIYDLNSNVTAQTVQNAIRGITFKTSGKGLKTTTRSVKIQLEDSEGDKSVEVSKTINVSKKKVKVPRGRSLADAAD